ncbi:hypothetical protein Tco_0915677 [Tanacetum coccineum]
MGEALILNRSLDPLYGDYIELNNLNEPLELRRNQVDGLEPTIKEGEFFDEFMMNIVKTWCDDEIIDELDEYPSYCDFDRKIHIDCAYNLQFSCMIGYGFVNAIDCAYNLQFSCMIGYGFVNAIDSFLELDEYPSYCDFDRKIHIDCAYNLQFSCMIGYGFVNANFFPLLSINVMSKSFYNSIMKDKVEYKGKNVVGAFMNVPIFVGKFSFVTDFAVVENMDAYRDDGMGDIIVGRSFCRKACVKARRFDGMINIYKWNDSVTYQIARSHPRFKHLINAQCNKMRPLLKVSAQDELKGLNTAYPGFGIRRINFLTLLNENDDFGEVLALGWHLEEIHVTWAHLEKKRTRLRLYTKNHEELFIQSLETASQP